MQSRQQTAVFGLMVIVMYIAFLFVPMAGPSIDGDSVHAQGYPVPSGTADGYPPPDSPPATQPATATEPPTATWTPATERIPTATSGLTSPTPTASSTPVIVLPPTRGPTPTRGPLIILPPTATERASDTTATQPAPGPAEPPTTTVPAASVTATAGSTDTSSPAPPAVATNVPALLPPVANQRPRPGAASTIIVGILLAGLAGWMWRRWLR